MAIDPRKIKVFKQIPETKSEIKELPKADLPKLEVYKKRIARPDADTNISLPIESLYGQDLLKVLEHDIRFNLEDFKKFVQNPGKYRIQSDNGYYIATTTNIYFIGNDGLEKQVGVTKFFGLYLIHCDRGEYCWLEEIK